ncbi:MAG: outer membrane beta-barrel protein [Candidatus Omnitrophica bacterium]|nr:outer membrane beta-barrel protein [Candidatus Omnitrophota bacterium]
MNKFWLEKTAYIFAFLLLATAAFGFDAEDLDVQVRANVSETYDDNITFAHQDAKKDFITSFSLGTDLKYEQKMRSLSLAANIFQQLFADCSDFNNTSQDLSLDYKQELSKYARLSLLNRFSHSYEPRSFEDAFGRSGGRYSYYRNRFSLGYIKDISKQLSVGARYANELNEISREDLADSYLNNFGLDATYFLSSNNILSGSYDFSNRNFNPGSSASTNSLATGLRHYFTEQLYFDGRAGLDIINSFFEKSYTKPLIFAALTSDIDETAQASLSFSQQYTTTSYTQDLFKQWRLSAALNKQLFKRLNCALSAFYGEGEYVSSSITDELNGASCSLRYDLNEQLTGTLSYSYTSVDSNLNTREYSKNRISLRLSYDF